MTTAEQWVQAWPAAPHVGWLRRVQADARRRDLAILLAIIQSGLTRAAAADAVAKIEGEIWELEKKLGPEGGEG